MKRFFLDRVRIAQEINDIVRLALPLILAQLAAVGTNVVDAVLAGHLNAHVQAAVTTAVSIWALAMIVGMGMMMAVSPSVAQLDGAGRRQEIGVLFAQALWLAWGVGVLLWCAVRYSIGLLELIGVVPSLRGDVANFLRVISWAAPALTTYSALRGLSEGLSLTRPSMYFSFGGLLLLAPLGYVLMYGRLGIPELGALGSGIASTFVLWLEMLGFALFVSRHPAYRDLGLRAGWARPNPKLILQLLRIGTPMAVSLFAEGSLFVAVALLIATLGETVVASHQVALNVASVAFMIPLGLSMAITVRVGNAVGRRDSTGVRYAGFCGIALALCIQCFSAGLMLSIPRFLASLYTNDAQVAALAARLMVLAGIFQFSDGIQVSANGALRGLKDTRIPMLLTLFAYWGIGMPVGWWLGFHCGLGARGMWMGLVAGLSVAAVLLFTRFWRSAWRERWQSMST